LSDAFEFDSFKKYNLIIKGASLPPSRIMDILQKYKGKTIWNDSMLIIFLFAPFKGGEASTVSYSN
jgi:hypothetical protein